MNFKNGYKYKFIKKEDKESSPSFFFIKFPDGSAGIKRGDGTDMFEGSPDSWKEALKDLEKNGFILDKSHIRENIKK